MRVYFKFFRVCGHCGKIIIPGIHRVRILPISGMVHKECADKFERQSVLFQLKGIAVMEEEEVKNGNK